MKAQEKQGSADPDQRLASVGMVLVGLALTLASMFVGMTWFGLLAALLLIGALSAFRSAYGLWSPENAAKLKESDREAEAEAKAVRDASNAAAKKRDEARTKANASKAEQRAKQQQFLDNIKKKAGHEPVVARVLGRGLPGFKGGSVALLTCRTSSLHVGSVVACFDMPIEFASLSKLEISGPGKSTTGGGAFGGGFGVEGAVEGILVASLLNVLTTREKNETYLTIRFDDEELMLQIVKLAPMELRVLLSPAMVSVDARTDRAKDGTSRSISEEIERLARQYRDGLLTAEEFSRAKASLLGRG